MAAALRDRHPFAFFGMARDRRLDVHRTLAQMAPYKRRVHACDRAPLDGAGESPVREITLRDDEQPRGVAVETMHDAGPALARAFRQRRPSPHEHVHETVAPVAGTGVHDESRRLVEHREMLVLVDEIQRSVERRVTAWGFFVRQRDRYFRTTFQDRR